MDITEQSKKHFKVIIAGTRSFDDYSLLCRKCDEILLKKAQTHSIVIISGTAKGADSLGERYACERGYTIQRFPADWKTSGKAAGVIRNAEMAKAADALICFWDGKSRGTYNMISQAKRNSLDTRIIKYLKKHIILPPPHSILMKFL